MANEAMGLVRRAEMRDDTPALRSVLAQLTLRPRSPTIAPPLIAVAWTSEIRRAEGQLVGSQRESPGIGDRQQPLHCWRLRYRGEGLLRVGQQRTTARTWRRTADSQAAQPDS